MTKTDKQLTKKQLAVIDDLLKGQLDEQAVLRVHKVSSKIWRNWFGCEVFLAEIAFRLDAMKRQSQYIIGRYAPIAAAKLVQLTESEKDETSRKACLDVIMLQSNDKNIESAEAEGAEHTEQLSSDQASRILAALAEVENNGH